MTSFGHSKPCQKTMYIYASLSLIISLIKLMSVNYAYNNKKNLTWIFMNGTVCYNLHLVSSSVDQLVVRFDQAAFDKLLAADRVKANKAKRRRHKVHATAARLTAAAPHSSMSLPPQRRRSVPSSSDRSISTPVRLHVY